MPLCRYAIRYAQAHTGCEVFNLGTGKGTSVLELLRAFEETLGKPIPYKVTERRPGDLATCWASTEKAAEILGWRADKTVADACEDSWRWQSMNPMGYGSR